MTILTNASVVAPRFFALIPAAGVGSRMGAACPKQYLELLGKPVLRYALEAFGTCDEIEGIYVLISQEDDWFNAFLASWPDLDAGRVRFLRCGGATRRETVLNGLDALFRECAPDDWILVHDAARPGLTPALIQRLIHAVADDKAGDKTGGLLALPVVDTVKRQGKNGLETVSRDGLWLAQTPQMFRYAILREALEKNGNVTDEAGAVEAMGLTPHLVEGHLRNTKITRPADLALVEMFLKADRDF